MVRRRSLAAGPVCWRTRKRGQRACGPAGKAWPPVKETATRACAYPSASLSRAVIRRPLIAFWTKLGFLPRCHHSIENAGCGCNHPPGGGACVRGWFSCDTHHSTTVYLVCVGWNRLHPLAATARRRLQAPPARRRGGRRGRGVRSDGEGGAALNPSSPTGWPRRRRGPPRRALLSPKVRCTLTCCPRARSWRCPTARSPCSSSPRLD